ncbi:hypothetical protein [Streptomyces sp. NRRL F-5126]|uniref:hypothetical protein n=1 Tax=Streptomyces sp. NRRL F-5126 TaxID=1463857 RepID=UPI00131D5FD5|nr:hypothetical protein [Streptomyces sp. NRRL F-5126]
MLDAKWGLNRDSSFPLGVGKEYVVYAITVVKDAFWYFLLDEHDLPYPVWYPSPLFQVSDGSIPAHWVVNYISNDASPDRIGASLITFKEWANDPSFYERLVEGEVGAVAAFHNEKNILSGGSF